MTDQVTGASERHEGRGAVGSPVERPVGPLADAAQAWLFFCSKPGKRMVFASIESSGVESWPWDEWSHVQRVALVPAGERETLWDKRPNVGGEARLAAHWPSQTTTATPQGVASTDELERR